MREQNVATAFLLDGVEARALDDRTLEVRSARAAQLLPVRLRLRLDVPVAEARLRAPRRRLEGAEPLVSNGPFMLAGADAEERAARREPVLGGRARQRRARSALDVRGAAHGARRVARRALRRARHARPVGRRRRRTRVEETYSNLSLMFLGFRADRAPFDDRARPPRGRARDRPRAARGDAVADRAAGDARRRDPAGDAGPLAPDRARPRPRSSRGKLLADAGYPGRQGPAGAAARAPPHRDAAEPCASSSGELGMRVTPSINPARSGRGTSAGRAALRHRLDRRLPGSRGALPGLLQRGLAVLPRRAGRGAARAGTALAGPGRADAAAPRARPALGRRARRDRAAPLLARRTCCGGRGSTAPRRTRSGASRSTPPSSVAVPQPDEPQALERQPRVDACRSSARAARSARRGRRSRRRGASGARARRGSARRSRRPGRRSRRRAPTGARSRCSCAITVGGST